MSPASRQAYLDFARDHGLAARLLSTTLTPEGVTVEVALAGPGAPQGLALGLPLDIASEGAYGLAELLLAMQSVCFVAEIPLADLPREKGRTQEETHRAMRDFQGKVAEALGNDAYDVFMTSLGHVEGWSIGRD